MEDLGTARGRGAARGLGDRLTDVVVAPARFWRPVDLRWLPVLLVVVALGLWEVFVRVGMVSGLFFPAPSSSLAELVRMTASGEMLVDLWTTVSRVARGFALGFGAGAAAGIVLGWSGRLYSALNPLIALAHPVPKISLLPLFLIIFGLGDTSTIAVVAISAFFPTAINTALGARQINEELFEVALSYRASRTTVLRRLVLPGSLPSIIAGGRLSLNAAFVVTIAIELLGYSDGLGGNVWFAWETVRTDRLFATIVVIALFGITSSALLEYAERRLAPWRPST